MIIISTRDFRANQIKFLDMANNGEDIVLKSREKGSFRIIPINTEDTVVGKRDLIAELSGALQQAKQHLEGKQKLQSIESLIDELRDRTL